MLRYALFTLDGRLVAADLTITQAIFLLCCQGGEIRPHQPTASAPKVEAEAASPYLRARRSLAAMERASGLTPSQLRVKRQAVRLGLADAAVRAEVQFGRGRRVQAEVKGVSRG